MLIFPRGSPWLWLQVPGLLRDIIIIFLTCPLIKTNLLARVVQVHDWQSRSCLHDLWQSRAEGCLQCQKLAAEEKTTSFTCCAFRQKFCSWWYQSCRDFLSQCFWSQPFRQVHKSWCYMQEFALKTWRRCRQKYSYRWIYKTPRQQFWRILQPCRSPVFHSRSYRVFLHIHIVWTPHIHNPKTKILHIKLWQRFGFV